MPEPRLELEYCTYCPKMCRLACPVSNATGRETWIPQAKMGGLNELRKGHSPWTLENTERLYACTGCRHCTLYCAHGNEPGRTLFAGRAEALKRGAAAPGLDRFPERLRAREEKIVATVAERVPASRRADSGPIALWPGCESLEHGLDDVTALMRLGDRLDGDGALPLARTVRVCGGYPLLAAGHVDAFRWHAGRVATELDRYERVVMSCSLCLYALRKLYPAEGIRPRAKIVHVSEHLEARLGGIELPESARKQTVAYHDPCHLVRYESLVQTPRKVLAKVADVTDSEWSGADTECCGAGGIMPETLPDAAAAMALRRIGRLAADDGPRTVVTSCGTCKQHLCASAPPGVQVRELAGYVEEVTKP